MPYATTAHLIAQFGAYEVTQITDRAKLGVVDEAVAADALRRASGEMDSYLAARYPLPLTVVPDQLVDICCDIARYKLVGAHATETDVVRLRYKDALKKLEGIRDGKIDVGVAEAGAAPVESASVQVAWGSGGSVFNADSLAGY